jgi:hypothetical protein
MGTGAPSMAAGTGRPRVAGAVDERAGTAGGVEYEEAMTPGEPDGICCGIRSSLREEFGSRRASRAARAAAGTAAEQGRVKLMVKPSLTRERWLRASSSGPGDVMS